MRPFPALRSRFYVFFNSTANHAERDSPGEAAGFWQDERRRQGSVFDEGRAAAGRFQATQAKLSISRDGVHKIPGWTRPLPARGGAAGGVRLEQSAGRQRFSRLDAGLRGTTSSAAGVEAHVAWRSAIEPIVRRCDSSGCAATNARPARGGTPERVRGSQRVASGFPSMRLFSDDIISGQPSTEPL